MKKDTILTCAGRKPEDNHGIVNPPVYHASTVTFPTVEALEAACKAPLDHVYYGRFGTPTTAAFEEAVAALEGGYKAIALPSGLAAISCALMAFLKSGDHLLLSDSCYQPTRKLCDGLLKGFGIETTYFDPMRGAGISELLRPKTKVVFVEAPGSLSFDIQDIPAIAQAAHKVGATVIMDNTWSAGFYFNAFENDVDVSVQAATKYIVGHADAMLGVVTTSEALYKKIKMAAIATGTCAGPDDCYLGLRGLRSLSTRLARHQETALKLAHWLEARPEVDLVLHPALPSCPGHEIWKRDFTGSSGLFAIVLRESYGKGAVNAMLDGMKLYAMGFSWGGYESLILPINTLGARSATQWPYKGPCIRIHAGLEDADDLINDLEQGLKRLNNG